MQEATNMQIVEFPTKAGKLVAAIFTPRGVAIIMQGNKPVAEDAAEKLSMDRLPAGYSLEPIIHYFRGCKLYTYTEWLYKYFSADTQLKMMCEYENLFL